ncbi:ComEA family DNA-binding protein [Natroniella sp. ANB-PHB2]|uniref:ComEA family DNA-binding protein n=1 Tax=Natroniella sp. ANB-PHB2 TaxID=3384444 RepID=UPI0038D36512
MKVCTCRKLVVLAIVAVVAVIAVNFAAYSIQQEQIINLNTATYEELKELPLVDTKKANKLLEYRNENNIEVLDELKRINGIGEVTIEAIKDRTNID